MVVYIAGNPWDGVVGTDRQLVTAISRSIPVLWIDPPVPALATLRGQPRRRTTASLKGLDIVGANICRLRVLGPPGFTRPFIRSLAGANQRYRISQLIRNLAADVVAVVVATPEGRFPKGVAGRKVYYVTDHWPAGAKMMGLNRHRIERMVQLNLQDADIAAAVSPDLLAQVLQGRSKQGKSLLLANGCSPELFATTSGQTVADVPDHPYAILVGQINERLDLAAVRAVADQGIRMIVVGPRTERDPATSSELDRLFAHPMVSWMGSRPVEELPAYLHAAAVGITPYVDNAFNRASFPLKTLEYLAAGLPVVSTDLPATRWLNTALVTVAVSAEEFGSKARLIAHTPSSAAQESERREFARSHSWDARARTFLAAI